MTDLKMWFGIVLMSLSPLFVDAFTIDTTIIDTTIYRVVEEMPRFPGCEDIDGDVLAKKRCANLNLVRFLHRNIKYPKLACENGVTGVVVIRFIVDEKGRIENTEIIRDIGYGVGEEYLRVINKMKELLWIPAKQNGQSVKVQLNLPIRTRLPILCD